MTKEEIEKLYELMLPILKQMNDRIKLIIEQNKEILKIKNGQKK